MKDALSTEYGTLRSFLWPIGREEARKVIPMTIMLFLICLCYSILRNMKDSVVVPAVGAEIIPYIKFWILLPSAVLVTYIFAKLTNRLTQERVFYLTVSFFIIGYALFGFVFYPMREALRPDALADYLTNLTGWSRLIDTFRHWTLTGFYVISELWSTMVMSVLFWGFANEVTKVGQARRYYSVFTMVSNLAAVLAGVTGNWFSANGIYNPNLPFGNDAWEQTVMIVVLLVIVSGLVIMGTFRWLNVYVLSSEPNLHSTGCEEEEKGIKVKKKKLSIRESVSLLSNSKYLICIATIVVAYNLVINLVEIVWKNQLKEVLVEAEVYYQYMNNVTTAIGVISMFATFFMPRFIEKLGWTKTALMTPVVMLVTCLGFFFFMFSQNLLGETLFGFQTAAICVFFGTIQICVCKAAKYSVFDATKEMSYIPLSQEFRIKGKAAIDGVGSRLGKSGGSVIHMGLLSFFTNLNASAPYVAAILVIVIGGWIVATRSLGRQFYALIHSTKKEEPKAQQPQEQVAVTV